MVSNTVVVPPVGWDDWFMGFAMMASLRSKDPSSKVGCAIAGPNRELLSVGYNGFARGATIDYKPEYWHDRSLKYANVIHAEVNAVGNAARMGHALKHGTAYVTMFPCTSCMKSIIAAGIKTVVAPRPDLGHERWGTAWRESDEVRKLAGVKYRVCELLNPCLLFPAVPPF